MESVNWLHLAVQVHRLAPICAQANSWAILLRLLVTYRGTPTNAQTHIGVPQRGDQVPHINRIKLLRIGRGVRAFYTVG